MVVKEDKCGDKESSKHFIACRNELTKRDVRVEWLKETSGLKRIRLVNEFLERKLKKRKKI